MNKVERSLTMLKRVDGFLPNLIGQKCQQDCIYACRFFQSILLTIIRVGDRKNLKDIFLQN